MIYHTDEYESERAILGLEDLATPSYYDPAAALIFAKRGTRSSLHELLHLNQLSATTSGVAVTAALAYRNLCIEFRIKALNEKFGAGLWSPVLGWLDSLYQGVGDEFHDPSYPYYHLSYLKRWIGSADSLLFALGYFDPAWALAELARATGLLASASEPERFQGASVLRYLNVPAAAFALAQWYVRLPAGRVNAELREGIYESQHSGLAQKELERALRAGGTGLPSGIENALALLEARRQFVHRPAARDIWARDYWDLVQSLEKKYRAQRP